MDVLKSLAGAEPTPYWLADPGAPEPAAALTAAESCDLAVVGGGYTGLWTALRAKERDPSADVVQLEADVAGGAASGRNGGFCSASLTHGLGNGLSRWPGEMATLERLGRENLDGIEDTIRRYGNDCEFERTGDLDVATEEWQLPELAAAVEAAAPFGRTLEFLDADAVRAEVDSPTYLGAVWDRDGVAMVNPARLAWGLRQACLTAGVRLFERTPVLSVEGGRDRLTLRTPYGSVSARHAALGTGGFDGPLRRLRAYIAPVYDYALVTEPLTPAQREAIGWKNRQGVGEVSNQFHYYRLTADDRILWGGYDAIYHYGGAVRAELERRPETFALLAGHFFTTFPQLEGVGFSHAWGGVIDTCSRFCAFFGTAHRGRLAYAAGYTGLGVGATRFGADVMLDLLSGEETERTRLAMVRSRPVPFPPEPLRYGVVQLFRWSLARADRREGRRNLWLRALDAMGVGFDS
jgi:glycine/D-amino acid oxidase-like deaminating enzyme